MTVTEPLAPSRDDLAAMSPEEFVDLIRAELSKPGQGMLNHPVVLDMEAGTATRDQLKLWTEQFYLHISKMLPWIGLMFTNCPYEEVRATLVKNLAEECLGTFTNTAAHPELLLRYAEALGDDAARIREAEQLPAGRRLTDYFEFMGRCREWYVPLAAIGIGLESFVPETFRRIVDANKANYGMSDDDLVFWTMHIIADEEHGDEGIEIVSEWVTDAEGRRHVYDCTIETGRLFHDLWMVYSQA